MLVAGSSVVLVMLVLLVKAVNSSSAPANPTVTAPAHERSAAPAPTHGAAPTAARSRTLPAIPSRILPAHRAEPAEDRPAPELVEDHPPPATRANTTHLEYGGTQLRAQAAAVEPLVKKCVEDAKAAGVSPTGKAVLTYIVAQHGDKVLVEDTSIDDTKTTLQGEQLLDCLRETARGMKFKGLPREAEALVVSRSITLDHGSITEYKHVGFSYLR